MNLKPTYQLKIFGAIIALFFLSTEFASAQKASWIWYPGDYEVWLSNKMQVRRTERGSLNPPFWKLDSHYVLVNFHKSFTLPADEDAAVYVEGQYSVQLDGKTISGTPKKLHIPAGRHHLNLKVYNQASVPTIYIESPHLVSDTSWRATFEDKQWIDETGKASDISASAFLPAGSWNFNDPNELPSAYHLPVEEHKAVSVEKGSHSMFVDFGKETFGYVKLLGLKGKGKMTLYYGESKEEALATETCELLDRIDIDQTSGDFSLPASRAFRFVNIQFDENVSANDVSMMYEYAPLKQRGGFRCSDDQVNKIWDVSAYTLSLASREFFIDGIKRDRWVWSGDAYQSYLMNYYLFFDSPEVTHTLLALRGKDPVTSHINTIMDYSFYWFMGIYDYYQYTGDKTFIDQYYPRMKSLMDYCLGRRDSDGLMQGLPGDWVFIDWADGLSKDGQLSFEQLLFCRSLETMALCAKIKGDTEGEAKYSKLAADVKAKIFKYYWNEQKQAFVHSRINGKPTDNVTRYTNMFSIFFNYMTDAQKQGIKNNVLLNNSVQKITTPYMQFYELESLCSIGEQPYVLKRMKEYWGGMLNLGATTFWELYNPDEKGAEHYAMYGRPFGKSLCHAWGASPIYLLGKYYLGVKPTAPGYKEYMIEPNLGGLQWMQGTVPTPNGDIKVFASNKIIRVSADSGTGLLRFKSKGKPSCKGVAITAKDGMYEMQVESGKEYVVNYSAL